MSAVERVIPFTETEELLRADKNLIVQECMLQDGRLYCQSWVPTSAMPQQAAAVVVYVHGYGDYSGRFAGRARMFLAAGLPMVTFDHLGHGRSQGLHGYIPDMQQLTDGLRDVLEYTRIKFPNSQIYLLTCSMGGLVALEYLVNAKASSVEEGKYVGEVAGLAMICPLIRAHPASRPNQFVTFVAKFVRAVCPSWAITPANRGKNHSDPAVEQEFIENPWTYSNNLRVGTGMSFLDGITDLAGKMERLTVPFFIAHGTNDLVTDPQASQELVQRAASIDKTLKMYQDGDHVLWIGAGEQCLNDALSWIQKRVNVGTVSTVQATYIREE